MPQKSTAPGANTKPVLGEELFAAGLCWDLLFPLPFEDQQIAKRVRVTQRRWKAFGLARDGCFFGGLFQSIFYFGLERIGQGSKLFLSY